MKLKVFSQKFVGMVGFPAISPNGTAALRRAFGFCQSRVFGAAAVPFGDTGLVSVSPNGRCLKKAGLNAPNFQFARMIIK